MTIQNVIKQKMMFTNLTQAKLAEMIGTSPTQLGLFLKGTGASLPTHTLQKCLDVLEINIDVYGRICESAVKVAKILKIKGCDEEKILHMTKDEMIEMTDARELKYLINIEDEKEIDDLSNHGLVDVQSTFPYFKAMVVYLVSMDGKMSSRTNSTVGTNVWTNLFGATAAASILLKGTVLGLGVISAVGAGILGAITMDENRPLRNLKELCKKIINIKY